MAIGSAVTTAAHMNPEILTVGGLHNELVKVSVVLNPIKPLAGSLHIGMALVIIPGGIAGEGQLNVSSFAQSVLGGVGATNLDVELVAAVAGADDNGTANEAAEGFEDFLAELLENWYILRWYSVIDTILLGSLGLLKFIK